jgi:hypothetical protein
VAKELLDFQISLQRAMEVNIYYIIEYERLFWLASWRFCEGGHSERGEIIIKARNYEVNQSACDSLCS